MIVAYEPIVVYLRRLHKSLLKRLYVNTGPIQGHFVVKVLSRGDNMGWQLRGGVSRVPETDQGMDLQLRLLSGKRDPTLGRIYVLVWSNCLTLTTKCLSPELKQRCLVGVATPCYSPLIELTLGRRHIHSQAVCCMPLAPFPLYLP